jgi:virginiamycin B lyase
MLDFTRASAVLACAIAMVGTAGASAAVPASPKAVGPHAKVIARISIPAGTGGLAIGEGAVWSLSWSRAMLLRIDPRKNLVTARVVVKPANPCPPEPDTCGQVAAGSGAVWVSMRPDNVVARVDPNTNKVTTLIPVGKEPDGIATSPGAVWVANHGTADDGPSVSRIDPATNQVVATISVGPGAACCSDHMGVGVGAGSVWVTVPNGNALARIDEATNAVTATITSTRSQDRPCGNVAISETAVWVAGASCGTAIRQIDPRTNRLSGRVNGSASPINVGLAFGSLWVADLDASSVLRVNPHTRRIIGVLHVGGIPVLLTVGLGSVWVRDDTGHVLRIAPRR